MARKRAGGTTGYAVALIIFVILFVFSLILSIIFYTQVSKAQNDVSVARNTLDKLAKRDQIARLEQEMANREGDTLVGLLQKDVSDLKNLIINDPSVTSDTLRGRVLELKPKTGLIQEIESLRATVQDNDKRVKSMEKAVADARADATRSEQEKSTNAKNFKETLDSIQDRLATMKNEFTGYQATIDQQRKALEEALSQARTSSEGRVKKLENELSAKNKEISDKDARIKDLEISLGKNPDAPAVDNSTNPDGSIVSVRSEQGVVYINLGMAQHVTPGLTFEVFDKGAAITKDGAGVTRGKATIEVTNVSNDSSTARIVRLSRNKSVIEGDTIINAVYDPNTRFKFVVFGEFDIDNTGQPSVADRRRIETLITQFNGILAEEMTYDTDFLVLGQEPKVPEALPRDEMDPAKIARAEAQARRYKQYQDLIVAAKTLSIPVLNQNRFLNLVGYYRR
ncbi:MAG: hypothetical protein IT444_03770 [Phycisphaeraceae bacterium]|nr:hypothetical protein [Phycisphaeraceae bacterium]